MSELLDIGVDIDEVLYDFVQAAREWLALEGHTHPMPQPTGWDIANEWGLTRDKFENACRRGVNAGYIFRVGSPIGWAAPLKALRRLARFGRIHLVTNRDFGDFNMARISTLDWLGVWGLPYDSLTFIENKADGPRCDVFVDDRPRNYDQLEAAGMHPYLFTHPWNDDHPGRRVRDLDEFVDVVRRMRDGG